MNAETKDLLKNVGVNATGTVLGAGVITLLVLFSGKISLVAMYWKEVLLSLILIFMALTLTIWFRKLLKIEKELERVKSSPKIDRETKAVQKIREDLIRTMKAVFSGNASPLERMIVELEIENFRNNHQLGELSGLIKKLHIDIKKDFFVRDTLMEIREYIQKSGMPHYYIEDLNKALKLIGDDFSMLKNEIATLSQEKLYKC